MPMRRRDRLREATFAEIKQLAWRQIAETGAASLSLRQIARDMGMTSSAIYRYFPSRDQLLTALATDGFASLADTLEGAERELASGRRQAAAGAGAGASFLHIVRAYRRWAQQHPTEYALMFGTPVPGSDLFGPETKAELDRGVNVLFRTMITGLAVGVLHPPPLAAHVARKLGAKLRRWDAREGTGLPPDALGACLFAWTQLHGAISLELFGHVAPELMPADELFDQQMYQVLAVLGCPVTQ
jgi:AcrR family transcriptional regulator